MAEESERTSGKLLSAEELLRNKGIRSKAWKEWDESSCALPKIGDHKRFEPDDSWLEKKQIEKGLASREFLLGIERVERASQLSTAEWSSSERRARVTKKIGSEWANFGHETNANLYLMAEEALILLETECLELLWHGVPMSIQQAYDVLIESDDSDCSLDEYRVYSQLIRLGYRLQRFHYEKSKLDKLTGHEEQIQRKKVIVDPEKGLWRTSNDSEQPSSKQPSKSEIDNDVAEVVENATTVKQASKSEIDNDVREIVENMVVAVNGNDDSSKNDSSTLTPRTTESKDSTVEKTADRKSKNSKVEIISEQTILSPVRIVKDGNVEHTVSKWPGSRIQRNVKLLPKRNDRLSAAGQIAESGNSKLTQDVNERTTEKRKLNQSGVDSPETKKSKHEIIELSDDEIEEIPRPMSRMEMLNLLPNIASKIFITENIAKRYVPRGVRAQSTYRYDSRKLRHLSENDRRKRTTTIDTVRNGNRGNDNNSSNSRALAIPTRSYANQPRFPSPGRHNYQNYPYYNRPSYVNQYSANSTVMNVAGTSYCMQQQFSVYRGGWNNRNYGNRWSSYQFNMFRQSGILGYAMRNVYMQNFYLAHCHNQNMAAIAQQFQQYRPRRYLDRSSISSNSNNSSRYNRTNEITRNASNYQSRPSTSQNSTATPSDDETYQATFSLSPGATTWPELKQKWRDAKTITIEDEEDPNDIQVVEENIKPLVNPKNGINFAEIFEKLRIIKSAPDRTVRRKKTDLKISYNVYSSTQHYRKANPGMPIFHLVVTSRKENVYLQPFELNRLQQDGQGAPIMFAHVSNASIAYLQPGIVNLPNLS